MNISDAAGLTPDRDLQLRVGGAVRRIRLAAPSAGEVITRISRSAGSDLDDLVFAVLEVVDLIDDEPPGLAEASAIVQDAEALGHLLGARNRWIGDLRTRARLLARCPHCGVREAALELVTVALALSSPLPPWLGPSGAFLAVPAVAAPHPPGRRRGSLPAAAEVGVELPTGRLAPEVDLQPRTGTAVLRNADDAVGMERQELAWERLAPAGAIPEPDHAYRHHGSVGFTALVRMAAAVDRLDDLATVGPEAIEALCFVDFLALDAAYHLAVNADQPRPDALAVECEHCAGRYVPLIGSQ